MADPFLAEIRIMSFNYPPKGWAMCNGQLLPINQNQALFSLLSTTYGGNGQTTFALPDLRGRTPIHRSNTHVQGESAGEATHTLSISELPQHSHPMIGLSSDATARQPGGSLLAYAHDESYGPTEAILASSATNAVGTVGGSQPHNNMQPYLTLNFCIALQGIFPSHT